MAKHNKFKKTLFFIEGHSATEAEIEASMEFEPGVQFRNASLHKDDTALETFDRLAGAVPARYQAAADAKAGKAPDDAPAAPAPARGAITPPPGSPVKPPGSPVKPPPANPSAGWSGNS